MADTTQEQIDGLREAVATGEFVLHNCRRAVDGQPPLSRIEYESRRIFSGPYTGANDARSRPSFGDIFGGMFGN